ncbi:laccase 1 AVT [Lentinula raphanica]|uniref:Laccase 1 AVT n=1 Tax=Lentinula raphanica TaxID=153919 RepID=A0AA38PHG7_9AGAR|nr:laccase 1 AVT [Lentinula raphanica]KAJ3968736.1 laccase 1 AVT [Lentinula raphanica]
MIPLISLFASGLACLVSGAEVIRDTTTSSTYGKTVNENIFVANKELAPDGFQRSTVLAGFGNPSAVTFPGPLISGNKGDRFALNVTDVLTDPSMVRSTTIHWHGLFQHTTNYADGVAFVSQCPIAANHSFLYDFQVPDQAGTFWYHSHIAVQYCDGLRGPLVVYDPQDPQAYLYDVDDESTVLTIADWFHNTSTELIAAAVAPPADATLINGKGRYLGGPAVPLAVINVQQGKRYRFRLISIACDANHMFSIDNHKLTIIEVDGENHEPTTVDSIQIFPGQRYSFVLDASQPVDNYWVRALSSSGVGLSGFIDGLNSAILRYQGAPDADPTTTNSTGVQLTESMLHPLEDPAAPGLPFPGGVGHVVNLTLGFNPPAQFFMQDVQYIPPTVPVLLQILSGAQAAQDLLPPGSVYTLPSNTTIEVNLFANNTPGGPHPFHLHGHSFSVVRSADNTTYNYDNPVRRDVTAVGADNQTTIRFVTDNPGPWFLHCHIDLHLEFGLAVVMAEAPNLVKGTDITTPAWDELCPIYDSLTPAQLP